MVNIYDFLIAWLFGLFSGYCLGALFVTVYMLGKIEKGRLKFGIF